MNDGVPGSDDGEQRASSPFWKVVFESNREVDGWSPATEKEERAMKTIKILGASDDILLVHGGSQYNEYGCFDKPFRVRIYRKDDSGKKEEMRVYGKYRGSWAFAVHRFSGDGDQPDWPVRHSWEGYSEVIEIDAPDDVKIKVRT